MPIKTDDREKIRSIVIEILEIEPDELTDTSLFKEDHDADSLMAVEILAQLEKTFGITIPQADLGQLVNLEAVYTVVDEAVSR
jgi:acyl carrier protein